MLTILKSSLRNFYPYAKKELGFDRPVRLFLRQDSENAKNVLGRTAHYDPDGDKIVLYITDRHPKDILRSFAHELVHHSQNCKGELDDLQLGPGYAQDGRGDELESEAYLGTKMVRDWEDNLKQNNQGRIMMNENQNTIEENSSEGLEALEDKLATLAADMGANQTKEGMAEYEALKKLISDKKAGIKEAEEAKYPKSQDKEHDDAKELGAKLSGKLKESNDTWYWSSLNEKLTKLWSK